MIMKNKKVLLFIIFAAVIGFVFSSCSFSQNGNMSISETQSSTIIKNNEEKISLLKKDDNYQIYQFHYSEYSSEYIYFIYDNEENRLDCKNVYAYEPHIEKIGNNVFKCVISGGSNANIVKYYNVSKDMISPEYKNVCYDNRNEVAYIKNYKGKTYFKLQKIFDNNAYFVKELDMDGITTTKFDVKIRDGKIFITHIKGKDYKEITEIFQYK